MNEKNVEYIKGLKGKLNDTGIRREIRRVFNVKKSQGNDIFTKIFGPQDAVKPEATKKASKPQQKRAAVKFKGNIGEAESIDPDVRTLEDLLAICQVDLEEWRVDHYIVNKWAVARKNDVKNLEFNAGAITGSIQDDGGMHTQPLYQVKAWLVRKKEVRDKKAIVAEFRKALQEESPHSFEASPVRTGFLYELSLPDIHIGKLAWKEESGENYDSNIACELYRRAVASLMTYIDPSKVERILLPVGNDMLNVDNAAGTTTAGTKQDEDSRFQRTFMKAAKLLTEVIEYLSEFAPVDVVVVQGNHDNERSFYLGEYLSAWFNKHPSVTIDNAPTSRKYYRWESNLIGMTHGNEEKHTELPLIMATERPTDWALCTYKTFQLGHWHKEKLEDIKGVQIHVLPSLCPPDAWHAKKGYVGSKRVAEGLLFDKDNGLVANYYFKA